MPVLGVVGATIATHYERTMSFEWEITDFFSLSDREGDCFLSNNISFARSSWCLGLFPNSTAGWLSLVILRKDSGKPRTVCVKFGIKRSDGVVEGRGEVNCEFSPDHKATGHPKFWSREELRNRGSTLMPNNKLTIICNLRCDFATEDASSSRELKVIRSMKSILDEGKRADFTLKLGQREWHVHKVILESRCEYFENMFRHDWVENTVGEVTFEDVEEGSLQAILDFIYTGSAENISAGNVCEIYAAAHKFLLDDLKSQCLEWMKKNMCLEIVCKVLVIGDRYEEKELKERAVEYFIQEGGEIMDSEEWKRLKKDHAPIVADFLEDAAKRQVKKRRIQ